MMHDLKGQKFTQVKYGKANWKRVVKDVYYKLETADGYDRIVPYILDEDDVLWPMHEIGILDFLD